MVYLCMKLNKNPKQIIVPKWIFQKKKKKEHILSKLSKPAVISNINNSFNF